MWLFVGVRDSRGNRKFTAVRLTNVYCTLFIVIIWSFVFHFRSVVETSLKYSTTGSCSEHLNEVFVTIFICWTHKRTKIDDTSRLHKFICLHHIDILTACLPNLFFGSVLRIYSRGTIHCHKSQQEPLPQF